MVKMSFRSACVILSLIIGLTAEEAGVVNEENLSQLNLQQTQNDELRSSWSSLIRSVEVVARGEIELTEDDQNIHSISEGGYLRIKERKWFTTRKVQIVPGPDGGLLYKFYIGYRSLDFEKYGRSWLKNILPEVVHKTFLGASGRMRRVLDEKGIDGVLEEISHLEGSYTKRVYFMKLLEIGDLDTESLIRVVRWAAKEITSNFELRQLLIFIARESAPNQRVTEELLTATQRITSSFERRSALTAIAEVRDLDTSSGIVAALAIAGISSDFEKSTSIITLLKFIPNEVAVLQELLKALDTIHSSFEKRRALEAFLSLNNLGDVILIQILKSSRSISSDFEKSCLLVQFAEVCPSDEEVLTEYLETARTIHSSFEKQQALTAILKKENLSQEFLQSALRFVEREIDSQYTREAVKEMITDRFQKDFYPK